MYMGNDSTTDSYSIRRSISFLNVSSQRKRNLRGAADIYFSLRDSISLVKLGVLRKVEDPG